MKIKFILNTIVHSYDTNILTVQKAKFADLKPNGANVMMKPLFTGHLPISGQKMDKVQLFPMHRATQHADLLPIHSTLTGTALLPDGGKVQHPEQAQIRVAI